MGIGLGVFTLFRLRVDTILLTAKVANSTTTSGCQWLVTGNSQRLFKILHPHKV